VQISTGGGRSAQWRPDGRELFYVGPDNRLIAAGLTLKASTVEVRTPTPLFSLPSGSYAVAPDSERFLVSIITAEPPPVTMLLNWTPRAKQ
jgi:hypothetical protein